MLQVFETNESYVIQRKSLSRSLLIYRRLYKDSKHIDTVFVSEEEANEPQRKQDYGKSLRLHRKVICKYVSYFDNLMRKANVYNISTEDKFFPLVVVVKKDDLPFLKSIVDLIYGERVTISKDTIEKFVTQAFALDLKLLKPSSVEFNCESFSRLMDYLSQKSIHAMQIENVPSLGASSTGNENFKTLNDVAKKSYAGTTGSCETYGKPFDDEISVGMSDDVQKSLDSGGDEVTCEESNEDELESAATFRPFKCSLCGKSFRRLYTLNRHQKVIHQKITLRCSVCSMKFKWHAQLGRHMKEHLSDRR